jgi:hypothetical protein
LVPLTSIVEVEGWRWGVETASNLTKAATGVEQTARESAARENFMLKIADCK